MKRIGLILALFACQLHAKKHVVLHVFPLVVEFKKIQEGYEPQWHILLGKNVAGDKAFTAGIFQEFGGTIQVGSFPEGGKAVDEYNKIIWNYAVNTYLTAGTNAIYNNGDLSSLIKKQKSYFDDQVYKLDTPTIDKDGIRHEFIYILLDVRKPLARLNVDGRSEYKTEFKWMLVSDIQKFSDADLKNQNVNTGLKSLLNDRWAFVTVHFIRRLCAKS